MSDSSARADFDAISPTAMLIAYYRQFTDVPWAAEIVRAAGAEQARDHGPSVVV